LLASVNEVLALLKKIFNFFFFFKETKYVLSFCQKQKRKNERKSKKERTKEEETVFKVKKKIKNLVTAQEGV
jgi:hypothetical protein